VPSPLGQKVEFRKVKGLFRTATSSLRISAPPLAVAKWIWPPKESSATLPLPFPSDPSGAGRAFTHFPQVSAILSFDFELVLFFCVFFLNPVVWGSKTFLRLVFSPLRRPFRYEAFALLNRGRGLGFSDPKILPLRGILPFPVKDGFSFIQRYFFQNMKAAIRVLLES